MQSKSTIAVGLTLGLLLLSWAGTGAQQQGQPAKEFVPLPEGLRQVPPDGMAFVYVRIAKFLELIEDHAIWSRAANLPALIVDFLDVGLAARRLDHLRPN